MALIMGQIGEKQKKSQFGMFLVNYVVTDLIDMFEENFLVKFVDTNFYTFSIFVYFKI